MARKLKKGEMRFIIGASGLIVGLYMIFVYGNYGGIVVGIIGLIILIWKKLNKWIGRKI